MKELESDDPRRVRCAAYLLGGAGRKAAAGAFATALPRFEKSAVTQAILVEGIGRSDPEGGAAVVEEAAASKSEHVRLAAIPVLGFLKSKKAEELIKEASESSKWVIRRAAVEACRNRRDLFAMDILMSRYPKETPRLQYDIQQVVRDVTGGVFPPDPKEWLKWWKLARKGFQASPRGARARSGKGVTVVANQLQPRYFGMEVWSHQLAIVLDISGSMSSSNLSLGGSGVGVTGTLKEGSPLAIAKDQIKGLLKKLHSRAQFNVVAYNQDVKPFKEALLVASKANLQGAAKYVDDLKAEGGTNVYGGVIAALRDQDVDTIYLLSDGEPTDGQRTDPDDILEAVNVFNRFRKTRIHTIQIGEDQELMQRLAGASDGKYQLLEVTGDKSKGKEKKPGN